MKKQEQFYKFSQKNSENLLMLILIFFLTTKVMEMNQLNIMFQMLTLIHLTKFLRKIEKMNLSN